jgi:nucleoside-diphosphate-sugar epimerase
VILITGNAGFIGTYLTSALLIKGNEIRGLDIRPRNDTMKGFVQVNGNILDRESVLSSLEGVDVIIHLAAEHKDFGITKEKYFEVNEQGTKNLLRCASEKGIKRFIFYSSVAVYGAVQPSTEETVPSPNNYYGSSKLAGEAVVRKWAEEDPTRSAIIIRPTVVFGARNRANIFKLVRQVVEGRFVWVGDGGNIKSVAFVENLVDATLFLLHRMSPGLEIFNYSDEPQLTTRKIVEIIAKESGARVPRIKIPLGFALSVGKLFDVAGKLTRYDFPITAARMKKFNTATCHYSNKIRSLGFTAKYTIEEGFAQQIRWYREHFRSETMFHETSE